MIYNSKISPQDLLSKCNFYFCKLDINLSNPFPREPLININLLFKESSPPSSWNFSRFANTRDFIYFTN